MGRHIESRFTLNQRQRNIVASRFSFLSEHCSGFVCLHYADQLFLTTDRWLNSLKEWTNSERSKLGQRRASWVFLSFSMATLGGALGAHTHRTDPQVRSACVHTHTCERTRACWHAAQAVRAAVCSLRFTLLSLIHSTLLPVKEKNPCWWPFPAWNGQCAGEARGGIDC